MDKYFPKPLCRKHANQELYQRWELVKATVQNWIWSWSDSRCETEEEFLLSKALFLKFIASNQVQQALGPQGVEQLEDFYCKRIEPHEDLFVFYRRRRLHLDTNSNSAHEGTNHGIKYHSIPVKPTHGIVESTKILMQQSKIKSGDAKIQSAQYNHSKIRGWSCLPTANSLTHLGESLVLKQWEESTNLFTTGPCDHKWLVVRKADAEFASTSTQKYPKFKRVRIVQRDQETGILHCSCCYFQRVGISCRHILAVLRSVLGNNFQGVTETSVRVFWWSKYSHYGVSNLEEHRPLLNLLLRLRDNDVDGPVLPLANLPANIDWADDVANPIVSMSRHPLSDCCCNYSSQQCNSALHDHLQVNDAPSTLSQDYWNFNDDDDGENSTDNLCAVNKHRARKTNVFEKLNPVFKSLVASIESTEATMEDIEEAFQDILKIEEKFKNRFSRKSRNTSSSSAFVSSNLPDNPRRKTHGTKHLC
jgi:hypothetical protein